MSEDAHKGIERSIGRLEGAVIAMREDITEWRQEAKENRAKTDTRLSCLETAVTRQKERERTIRWLLGGSIPVAGAVAWFHDKLLHIFK